MITIADLPDSTVYCSMDWSSELRKLRKQIGVTQSRMAVMLGVSSKNYISSLESGTRVFTPMVIRGIEHIRLLYEYGHKF